MPTPDPTDAFLAALATSGLLPPDRHADIVAWATEYRPDPSTLAKELTRRGWLTNYQVKEIYKGRGKELVIGPYQVLDLLGEGGMGRVYKAHHTRLGRDVALKVIRKEKLTNPIAVQRFHQEVRAAAQLQHPNVVLAFDADEADGLHFFSMELVDGTDLTKLVQRNGAMPIDIGCDAIRQGALGLQHAFERGLVHRDIKPSNLIMTPKRQVKLLDLGLALLHEPMALAGGENANRVTQEGYVLGTPDFLAPEQAQNPGGVDIRADIYGLGATLFYLLTAKVPFEGANPTEKLLKHITDPPPSLTKYLPNPPPQLDAIVQWMMAKRPEQRPQTPAQVAAALAPFCPLQSGTGPTLALTATFQQPVAAMPAMPMPMPMPVPAYPPAMPAGPDPGAAAFAGFDANEDAEPEEDRPRRRRRDDDEDERPRKKPKKAGVKVRAPKERSSLPTYLIIGGGVLAVIVVLIIVVVSLVNREADASRPLDQEFTTFAGSKMVLIQPGNFRMGSEPAEEGRGEEEGPAHEVTLTKPFYMSVTEVTDTQFRKLIPESPTMLRLNYNASIAGNVPMDGVTWDEAVRYCKKLTERVDRLGRSEQRKYGWRPGWAFRLPTEAEWEYCCRAGSREPFGNGKTLMMEKEAIFKIDETDQYGTEKPDPHRRPPKPYPAVPTPLPEADPMADISYRVPNKFGLIDMHGNLWEWCRDNYASYDAAAVTDPIGPAKPDKANWKVLRGGSWDTPATVCRSASRKGLPANTQKGDIGFRIVYAPVE